MPNQPPISDDRTSRIGLILLAAGASRRMKNRAKQLLEFEGETLLRRAAKTALASGCRPVCVVLGANSERLRAEIADLPLAVVVNENWASGMASSLQTGLRKLLEENAEIAAVCVLLADQPLVDFRVVNRLVETFERGGGDAITASRYAETVGVPAIFPRRLFGELADLTGDAGARKIIGEHASETVTIDVPEAAHDIDSPPDYERLTAFAEKKKMI